MPTTTTQTAPARRRFVRRAPTNTSTVSETITLRTREANVIWEACAEQIKAECANLQIRLVNTMPRNDYDALEEVVKEDLKSLEAQAQTQLKAVEEQTLGAKLDEVKFPNAHAITITRNSPLYKSFVDGILLVDQIFVRVESLWLNGAYNTRDKAELSQSWTGIYRSMSGKIMSLVGHAMNQARAAREQAMAQRANRGRAETAEAAKPEEKVPESAEAETAPVEEKPAQETPETAALEKTAPETKEPEAEAKEEETKPKARTRRTRAKANE